MNLYLLTQDVNVGWNTYDSAIVCAESEAEAVKFHPDGTFFDSMWLATYDWVKIPSDVKCKKIGVADDSIEKGVVLDSFNAG